MVRLTQAFRSDQLARYVELTYREATTRVAVTLIPVGGDRQVIERFVEAGWLLRADVQRFPAARNAAGYGAYAAPNPLVLGARRRAEETVREASCVWLDLDHEADRHVEVVAAELPPATLVGRTSPGRCQVIWRLAEPLSKGEARSVLRALAQRYGGDRAVTDTCRLLRLPGFANSKYPDLPLSSRIVRIDGGAQRAEDPDPFRRLGRERSPAPSLHATCRNAGTGYSCDRQPPPEIADDEQLLLFWRGIGRGATWTANERDLALAHGLRRKGVPFERALEILRDSPNRERGRPKAHMMQYLSLTLHKARYRPA